MNTLFWLAVSIVVGVAVWSAADWYRCSRAEKPTAKLDPVIGKDQHGPQRRAALPFQRPTVRDLDRQRRRELMTAVDPSSSKQVH